MPAAPVQQARALGERVGHLLLLLGNGLLVHQRPDVGVVEPPAHRQRRRSLGEAPAEGVVDRALDVEAVGAQTVLAKSEEHTSELQSLMRISYAVFCLRKKKKKKTI